MGMGEPLHNIHNVIKAADIMVDDQGLHFSPRKITVSTSGLVPQLRRYLRESSCAIAVSLNATTDEVRNWIMPINRKYNIGVLLRTLREELRFKNNYKVLFEYVMLAGVNDSIEDARRLADLDIPCKINLISFNPHSGSHFRPTSDKKMVEFRNYLATAGHVVFMLPSRGDDHMAACGQLGKPGEIQAPMLRVPEKFRTATQVVVCDYLDVFFTEAYCCIQDKAFQAHLILRLRCLSISVLSVSWNITWVSDPFVSPWQKIQTYLFGRKGCYILPKGLKLYLNLNLCRRLHCVCVLHKTILLPSVI